MTFSNFVLCCYFCCCCCCFYLFFFTPYFFSENNNKIKASRILHNTLPVPYHGRVTKHVEKMAMSIFGVPLPQNNMPCTTSWSNCPPTFNMIQTENWRRSCLVTKCRRKQSLKSVITLIKIWCTITSKQYVLYHLMV